MQVLFKMAKLTEQHAIQASLNSIAQQKEQEVVRKDEKDLCEIVRR